MFRRILAGLVLLSLGVAWAGPAERSRELRIRFQVFSIHGAMSEEELGGGDLWAGKREDWKKIQKDVSLVEHGRFRLGGDTLEIGAKGCFWNGVQLFFGEKPALSFPADRLRWIPAPDAYLSPGELTKVRIESKQSFEYYTRRPDGLFEQIRLELPTGLLIQGRPIKSGRKVELKDLSISVQSVSRREPVPGATLPIGKPVLSNIEYKIPLRLELRRPCGILLRAGEGHGSILVCLDVTNIPPEVWSTIRREQPEARVESVDWESDSAVYDVDGRTAQGRKLGMKIAPDGTLQSLSIEQKESELPEPVRRAIASLPDGSHPGDLEKTTAPGATYYRFRARVGGQDKREFRVSERGEFLKQ